jgi:hypothetical protein
MTVLAIGVLYAYRTAFVPVHHEDPVLGAELDTKLPAPVAA